MRTVTMIPAIVQATEGSIASPSIQSMRPNQTHGRHVPASETRIGSGSHHLMRRNDYPETSPLYANSPQTRTIRQLITSGKCVTLRTRLMLGIPSLAPLHASSAVRSSISKAVVRHQQVGLGTG